MDVQRREQALSDQLQLYRNQLEATKVRHCSSIKTVVCVHACMRVCVCVCVLRVCDFIKIAVWRLKRSLEDTANLNKLYVEHFLSMKVLCTRYILNEQK